SSRRRVVDSSGAPGMGRHRAGTGHNLATTRGARRAASVERSGETQAQRWRRAHRRGTMGTTEGARGGGKTGDAGPRRARGAARGRSASFASFAQDTGPPRLAGAREAQPPARTIDVDLSRVREAIQPGVATLSTERLS